MMITVTAGKTNVTMNDAEKQARWDSLSSSQQEIIQLMSRGYTKESTLVLFLVDLYRVNEVRERTNPQGSYLLAGKYGFLNPESYFEDLVNEGIIKQKVDTTGDLRFVYYKFTFLGRLLANEFCKK